MVHALDITDVQTDVHIVPVDCDSWLRNLLKLPTLCLVMVHGLGIYSLSGAPLPKLQGPRTVVQVTVSKRLTFWNRSLCFHGVSKVSGILLQS